MSFSYYGPLCTEVYNATKPVGQSLGGDIEFYRDYLMNCNGRILEAMSGSGRMLIPLLEAGLNVDGLDYSTDMLDSCRALCTERGLPLPELFAADLETLDLPYRYEVIIIAAGSLLLIQDRQASIKALHNLYQHLEPGGRLVLDLFLPDVTNTTSHYSGTSTVQLPDGDTITMESKDIEVNMLQQYKVSLIRYEKWRHGTLIATELQQLALRWYGVEEMRMILEQIGFVEVIVYADFDPDQEPSRSDQKFVFEATRGLPSEVDSLSGQSAIESTTPG
ncbi:class I SAM-dependent methyltransferase [Paenibacillus taichungensis]|uniref:Class I SAM-dependent methyltransferase n=1 Tax=Paenibacillus taichungensis TaxID=484184 RepID=A0ABX2MLT1_9BACL|nr:class I SAM-dependent methyltransferase [Paenibacillus taichungensis]NUU55009.1 class I SAM-dependent methyltransferase [Paenibacillus taichungensis]